MKKNDVMPGGKYFPIFWFEVFGAFLLITVIMLIVGRIKDTKNPGDVAYQPGTTPGVLAPGESGGEGAISGEKKPVPTKLPSERTDTENLQREILDLYSSADTYYGMKYRGKSLTADGFADAFFHGTGSKITASEVEIGDYAKGDGVSGICVGFYGQYPVFAYMEEYTANGKNENGMCLGYSREMNDALFFGMYPRTFTEYYSFYEDVAEEDVFPSYYAKMESAPWYVTKAYEIGTKMSAMDIDYLVDSMLHEKLSARHLKLHQEKFTDYLTKLPYLQGFEGTYDVMVRDLREKDTYTEVTIAFVPHNMSRITPMGEWKLTFYPKYGKFLPCGIDIAGSSEVGFVRDEEVKITTDESGKVTIEREEIIYGQTVDENGKRIYRFEDGTVIYLD